MNTNANYTKRIMDSPLNQISSFDHAQAISESLLKQDLDNDFAFIEDFYQETMINLLGGIILRLSKEKSKEKNLSIAHAIESTQYSILILLPFLEEDAEVKTYIGELIKAWKNQAYFQIAAIDQIRENVFQNLRSHLFKQMQLNPDAAPAYDTPSTDVFFILKKYLDENFFLINN